MAACADLTCYYVQWLESQNLPASLLVGIGYSDVIVKKDWVDSEIFINM